jgi:actin-like ATPase involved in cell morphogenesis
VAPTHRLAIDLGTCHTVAVVRRGEEAPRPLLFDGSPLLSSGVYADSSGALTVGRDAERLSQGDPSRFEPYPKRRVDEGSVLLGETETPVVELLAALLRRVVAEAMQSGINPVGATVLTCPADWGGQRRNVLLAAARSANLGPVELVDEPIAAATYCVRVLGQQIAPLECLAVFDFGGGTLDVSVVRRELDGLRVLAVGGLDDLGGVDIDAALVGHLGQLIELRTPAIWQRLSTPVGAGAQRDRRVFWSEVRGAKEMLSRASSAPVHVPGTEEALHLTREELERVAGPLIDRAVDETRRVLQRAGVGTAQLAGIFLVGGSSRIPLVSSRLHARFHRAPTVPEQPELPVAYGGMIAAAGTAPTVPPPPIQRAPMTGAMPVSGSPISPPTGFAAVPMSPAGSYPPGPISPPIPASTSFPPIQVAPGGVPVGAHRPPYMPAPGVGPVPVMVPEPPPIGQRPPGGPRRKRSRWPRYVILAVVVALVAGCGFGGYKLIRGWVGAINGAVNNPGGLTGGAGGPGGSGKALTDLGKVALTGEGAVTAMAGGGAVFSAVTSNGKTKVTRYDPSGLKPKWAVDVAVEPKEVKLTLAGSLLVIDADDSATNGGKDVRAVLDANSGAQKWLAPHDTQRDVAYLDTDVIVETDGFSDSTFKRVSLLDGKTKWSKPSGIDNVTSGHFWSGPVLVNGLVGGNASRALLPWPSEDPSAINFHEPISVDANTLVTLNNDSGKGSVVNAANGNAKVTGDVPIDDEHWVAFAGVIVGKFTDDKSPGKTVIAAYGLDNLKQRWTLPLNAGDDLERIKPCGPAIICVRASVADSKHKVIALGAADGKEKWNKVADFADEQDWYLTGSDLLFGEWAFGAIGGEPAALVPDSGAVRISLKNGVVSPTVVAADGTHLLLRGVKVGAGATTIWQVAVYDLAARKASAGVDLPGGTDLPKVTQISGDLVVGVTASRDLHVWRIPK